jgi:hypothetical protein
MCHQASEFMGLPDFSIEMGLSTRINQIGVQGAGKAP